LLADFIGNFQATADKDYERQMINSISAVNPAGSLPPQQRSAPPPAHSSTSTPQDSVTLSKQALAAAGGDADHDGDSR
jgi:hypothetical protein